MSAPDDVGTIVDVIPPDTITSPSVVVDDGPPDGPMGRWKAVEAARDAVQTVSNTAFEGGVVGVDPDVLVETAEAAFRQIAAYRQGLETVTKLIDSSEGIWVGEAGDAFRQVFKLELSKVEETLDAYAAYPGDLLEFAGLYSDSIAKAEGYASSVSEFKMI